MAYDTYEAARLISWSNKQAGLGSLTEAELIEWINAGIGGLDWAFTYKDDREEIWYIDFPTLISLRLICLLHFVGVSKETINKATLELRQELGVEWPFASKVIWNLHEKRTNDSTDEDEAGEFKNLKEKWRYIYWQLWGERHHRRTLDVGLDYDQHGIACAWLPAKDIKLDPQFVTGSPCLAGTRIPTGIIIGMVKAGDSVEELAEDYDVGEERIINAVKWENQLADDVV